MSSIAFSSIEINLSQISKGLLLIIDAKEKDTLFKCNDAEQEGESPYQIIEGRFYDYEFSASNFRFKKTDFIQAHSRKQHIGIIAPNVYVGTLKLEIYEENNPEVFYQLKLEVRSIKSDYRTDYRYMLESITERCTDLIMQIDSPITQHFETDFNKNPETLYQRFSFVKSLIDSLEFEEAIQKIVSNPTTKWEEEHEVKDIRSIRRFNQNNIKQLVTKSNRMKISSDHFLNKSYGLSSIPTKIDGTRKTESIDTAENRFVKHALEEFLFFCENCESKFEKYSTAKLESGLLAIKISTLLNQSFFKQISRPSSLKLNSPVLQRKSGYREVLNAWLKFDLAAKLIWHGGDNVYDAGKKDIATLYEYWLFFTLLDLLKEVFEVEPKSIPELIQYDKGQLSLNLKQGTAIAMKGVFKSPTRNLNIQFSYNRSFGGRKTYPNSGSYTTTLRPDYTLSIWPGEITEAKEAEKTELITHIHFDAKYKVNNFYELISKSKDEELTEEENILLIKEEKEELKKGTFKNQDLLKMHAYKDAIRRTSGAYVLYPGEGKNEPFRGFHEIIPGLGAFVIKPNKDDKDKEHLKSFIKKVIANFIDRASQREYTATKIYDIHKQEKKDYLEDGLTPNILAEPLPEYVSNKKLIPRETYVLVGYYKHDDHLSWIDEKRLYNVRYGEKYELSTNEIGVQYLLLYSKGQTESSLFFKLKNNGSKVYSKTELENILQYKTTPSQEMYLVYQLEDEIEKEFVGLNIDLRKLEGLGENKRPIAISIEELLKSKLK
jgi:predicted component of viral defense system (DUF524 family)